MGKDLHFFLLMLAGQCFFNVVLFLFQQINSKVVESFSFLEKKAFKECKLEAVR